MPRTFTVGRDEGHLEGGVNPADLDKPIGNRLGLEGAVLEVSHGGPSCPLGVPDGTKPLLRSGRPLSTSRP